MQKNRKLSVKIPAGVDDGTQIRLAGEGEEGIWEQVLEDLEIDAFRVVEEPR